jgi:anaerobic ribonucleoside-triphosphate reductase activating protein
MNYIKITKHDIANGQGVRVVLWCSGCTCCCSKCHNPQTWDFNAGQKFDALAKEEIYNALNHSYIQGITLSGGHPFEVKNCDQDFYNFIKELKEKFPTKDIWAYTGWSWEEIENQNPIAWKLIQDFIDVVVDGPYIEELKDITLKFRGSKNQRLIDVKKTFESGELTLLK